MVGRSPQCGPGVSLSTITPMPTSLFKGLIHLTSCQRQYVTNPTLHVPHNPWMTFSEKLISFAQPLACPFWSLPRVGVECFFRIVDDDISPVLVRHCASMLPKITIPGLRIFLRYTCFNRYRYSVDAVRWARILGDRNMFFLGRWPGNE